MKRKVLSVLLVLALVMGSMAFNTGRVYAEVSGDGSWEYFVEDGKAFITDYLGSEENIVIPSVIDGYPVKEVNKLGFGPKTFVRSVVISDGIERIGRKNSTQYIFGGWTNLESVVIPSSVTYIGVSAFEGCSKLVSIDLPGVVEIDAKAFKDCTSLQAVNLSSSIRTIGNSAFEGCSNLQNITLPEGLQTIGVYAFMYCTSLTSVIIPSTVSLIGVGAFNVCSNMTEVTILNPNATIGMEYADNSTVFPTQAVIVGFDPSTAKDYAMQYGRVFRVYGSSSGGVEPPGSEEPPSGGTEPPSGGGEAPPSSGEEPPSGGNELTYGSFSGFNYTIENGEITITSYSGSESEIVIPESINGYPVTKIGFSAFGYQPNITKVTIPSSITYIDYYAFYECSSLTEIVILNPNVYIVDNPGVFPEQAKIVGYDPSTAKDYAVKYGRTFEVYGGGQPSGGSTPPPSSSGTGDGSSVQIIGSVEASTITITAPLVVSFSIDPNNKERPLVTEDLVLTNNGNAAVNVYVKSVVSQDMQIIPSDSYTVDGWKRLSKFETERKLALLLGGKDLANADNLFLVTLKGKETKSLPVDVKHGLAFPMAKSCSIQVVLSYSLN